MRYINAVEPNFDVLGDDPVLSTIKADSINSNGFVCIKNSLTQSTQSVHILCALDLCLCKEKRESNPEMVDSNAGHCLQLLMNC